MKKIIIFSLFIAFVFSANLSLAVSYPSTCPEVARGILNAIVGGCSSIDRAVYPSIYDKCCVKVVAPVKTSTSDTSSKSTITPSPKPLIAPTPKPASETKTAVSPATSSVSAPVPPSSVIEENVPPLQTGFATTTTPKETAVNFAGFIKSVFTGLFRLFGFGK